ncbi:hypothetical protein QE449_003772 [Rhodococcus sp. SORGH_AS303]|nr:hypothetical protein [Rhodococcus sp. SORGH_AS_0303]
MTLVVAALVILVAQNVVQGTVLMPIFPTAAEHAVFGQPPVSVR